MIYKTLISITSFNYLHFSSAKGVERCFPERNVANRQQNHRRMRENVRPDGGDATWFLLELQSQVCIENDLVWVDSWKIQRNLDFHRNFWMLLNQYHYFL